MSDTLDLPPLSFARIPFRVIWLDDDLSMPDWTQPAFMVNRHVPGSDRTIVQTLGKGPFTVTYRLWFDTFTDFRAMQAKVQRVDTLVLFADMTSADGANVTYIDIYGKGYVSITGVTLTELGQPAVFREGAGFICVEVDATFQRSTL